MVFKLSSHFLLTLLTLLTLEGSSIFTAESIVSYDGILIPKISVAKKKVKNATRHYKNVILDPNILSFETIEDLLWTELQNNWSGRAPKKYLHFHP